MQVVAIQCHIAARYLHIGMPARRRGMLYRITRLEYRGVYPSILVQSHGALVAVGRGDEA